MITNLKFEMKSKREIDLFHSIQKIIILFFEKSEW